MPLFAKWLKLLNTKRNEKMKYLTRYTLNFYICFLNTWALATNKRVVSTILFRICPTETVKGTGATLQPSKTFFNSEVFM